MRDLPERGAGGVSVIIPAHNAASTIMRTLRSLVPERGVISEILIMNDGSTDDTAEVSLGAGRHYDLPVRVVPVDCGSAGGARNAGIEIANGEFTFFIDADDEVISRGLRTLHQSLVRNPSAGIALGATVRRTRGRRDKIKTPFGYSSEPSVNARHYFDNDTWPIAMGSALLVSECLAGIRFPESIGLDEDTCFWTSLLSREQVTVETTPVLLYHLDERRMAERLIQQPRRTLLAISREFDRLEKFGIDRETIQRRKAWVALRIARQLLLERNHVESASILRVPKAHSEFRHGWKVFQYGMRISAGIKLGRSEQKNVIRAPSRSSPRTLVLTYDPAWPPVSGADLRYWDLARSASVCGPVQLVSVRADNQVEPPAETNVRVSSLSLPSDQRSPPLVRNRTSVEPRIPKIAVERMIRVIEHFKPTAIVVCGIPLCGLLRHLRPHVRLLILDMANVETDLARQAQIHAPLTQRIRRSLKNDVHRIRKRERAAVRICDGVWVCSENDCERLLSFSKPKSITIVPNGIPRRDQTPLELPACAPKEDGWPIVLFAGHLGYGPNIGAAERLARGVLPRMRRDFPQTKIVLAGRYPKPAVMSLAAIPGVEIIDNPPDLRDLYRRSHLCIAPISFGGGTRIKILEAISWGLPVVATSCAVEGLGLTDGLDVALSETDEGLAIRACELCADTTRFQRQRRLAHAWVWQHYGTAAVDRAVHSGLCSSCEASELEGITLTPQTTTGDHSE